MIFSGQRADMAFAAVTQPARKTQQLIRGGAALESIAAQINSLIDVIRRIEGYVESNQESPKHGLQALS